ncbi:MAG: dTDP-4-dehydrorhamnose reductase [Bdellovibrionota bacterium]
MALSGKKILVLGSSGMLAGDLIPSLERNSADVELADLRQTGAFAHRIRSVDITDLAACKQLLHELRPLWVVNCAAYTAVDQAETQYGPALDVNAVGVANIAHAAREVHANVVHFSTDYVFGGDSVSPEHGATRAEARPHREDDRRAPCGLYGHSKRLGEDLLTALLPNNHLLLRTSWLHGVAGPNFVDTMLRLGKELPQLKVVNDQTGSPTWTGWLAQVTTKLLQKDVRGTYHASSRGGITWYDFAREIFRQAGLTVDVQPQSTAELGRPAPRPKYSVLDVGKLEKVLGEVCISWQDCVSEHLRARGIEVKQHA